MRHAAFAIGLLVTFCSCKIVPPGADAGAGTNKEPGKPFGENECFQCSFLRGCGGASMACAEEAGCARWLNCVAACPTDDTGVAAESKCLSKCGLPVSAQVLYECVQDFSTASLLGCERSCEPL